MIFRFFKATSMMTCVGSFFKLVRLIKVPTYKRRSICVLEISRMLQKFTVYYLGLGYQTCNVAPYQESSPTNYYSCNCNLCAYGYNGSFGGGGIPSVGTYNDVGYGVK